MFEINAMEMFQTLDSLISYYCGKYTGIEGLAFSTQMHGCVYHDAAKRTDLYLSWQDTRCLDAVPGTGESPLERLNKLIAPEELINAGVPLKPALAFSNLYALSLTESRWKKDYSRMEIYSLGSYFIYTLTGRNICHITNAAPMGMADIREGRWIAGLWEKAGLGELRLPEITSTFEPVGTFERNGMSINVYPDIGDQQVSVLGCQAKDGDILVNAATAGQVIRVTGDFVPGDYEIRPFFDGKYLEVVSRMPAGRNFDVLIDFIGEIGKRLFDVSLDREEIWKRLRAGCRAGQDTGGLEGDIGFYELPDREAGGHISHINHYNLSLENVISALLKDTGRLYARYIETLLSGKPREKGRIIFCGGLAGRWRDFIDAVLRESGLRRQEMVITGESLRGMVEITTKIKKNA
jgi:sugar (pentulose or hexulose) kinase